MRQVKGADYAPSRAAYRLQRLWLTPALRALLRIGLPAVLVIGGAAGWLMSDGTMARLAQSAAEMRRQVEDRPSFRVDALQVTGAPPSLGAEVEEALALTLPESSLRLDLPALRAAAAALPRVAEARLSVAGGVLTAEITPRVPAILHRGPAGLTVHDASGARLMAAGSRAAHPDLPLIAGEGGAARVGEALEVIAAAGGLAPRLAGLTRIGGRRWDAVLSTGQRVLLPEDAPVAAMRRAAAMDAGRAITSRAVTMIDLRLSGRPVLRLTPEGAADLRRSRDETLAEDPPAL